MNLEELARQAATARGLRILWWSVSALLVLGFSAFIAEGADRPPDPELLVASRVPGFGEVSFQVTRATGKEGAAAAGLCALLASTTEQQVRGFTGRTDAAGYTGMVFVHRAEQPVTRGFIMTNVPLPLSIAWFDGQGRFIAAAPMEPCGPGPCPAYRSPKPFRYALEAPRGTLGALGVGPGSVLSVGGPCPKPPG